MNLYNKFLNMIRKVMKKDYVLKENTPCPVCNKLGWKETVRGVPPHYHHIEGECLKCNLKIPAYYYIEKCPICGKSTYFCVGLGGSIHIGAKIPYDRSGSCPSCSYQHDAHGRNYFLGIECSSISKVDAIEVYLKELKDMGFSFIKDKELAHPLFGSVHFLDIIKENSHPNLRVPWKVAILSNTK